MKAYKKFGLTVTIIETGFVFRCQLFIFRSNSLRLELKTFFLIASWNAMIPAN